ncbi:MAG: hypothetical protein M5R37_13840 [Melioribacteraceae bacterium]|nr:hypothetical protein [Melioribacteraceae bacterium]
MDRNKINLNQNWKFSISEKSRGMEYIPAGLIEHGTWFNAIVPGTIHTDLLNNKLIDDPYYADNETKLNWIAEQDWIYKTEFSIDTEKNINYYLVLNGIDTIADVYLNENKILSCSNMFVKYEKKLNKYLSKEKNELKIYFYSPVKYAESKEANYGRLPVELNSYRAYIRKAQYSFGWDWGPSFPTSGIWRDVYIEKRTSAKIESIRFDTIKITPSKAKVKISVYIKCEANQKHKLLLTLAGESKEIKVNDSGIYEIKLSIKNPRLWFPNGEGEPYLYELDLSLLNKQGAEIDHCKKKAGIRTIELIKRERKENTFKLRINGRDIFAKGVNWIPADSFLPRVDNDKYKQLLTLARDANMNIVRVWGGGVYESDYFYELCDELGLLVWQDFMFACGSYPEQKEFVNNVKEEVEQNVKRLQHHPSIALWCGNNENEWIWFQKYSPDYKEMPGYKIYHKIIPDILKDFDAQRPYHPSSPFGDDEDPNSFNSGNTHQWKIWSMWVDYTQVVNDKSLFVTEFGFQGPANKDTLEKVVPKENRKTHDRIFEFHNKQVEGPERIWRFLSAHLPVLENWDDYLYLSQLNQGFALKTCLEHWRTNGKTNGALIWQINDSWPVTSWSIIDYNLKPKLAYHFVKNIFSPQLIYFSEKNEIIKVKLQNQSNDEFKGEYRLTVVDTLSGKIIGEQNGKVKMKGGRTDSINEFKKSNFLNSNKVIIARLYNTSDKLISINYYHHKPWKHYQTAESNISLKLIEEENKKKIIASSDKPSYFVDLYANGVEFSNRGFTILPNEEIIIDIMNIKKLFDFNDIKIFSLNNYLH